ncbi:MAG: ABC transporter ATP-binding protein [Angelakisella sp.]
MNKVAYKADKVQRKHLSSDTILEADYTTTMRSKDNLLEIENLKSYFYTDAGTVKAVDGVSIDIPASKTVGIVGESGCGKSVMSLSIMRLLQGPVGQIVDGSIRFNNNNRVVDLTRLPEEKMREVRGKEIAMIFQEPMTSLNPVFTIGKQLDEAILLHMPGKNKGEVRKMSIEMLETVGIARAEGIYHSYPHELSGGMRQRVMIAMALSCQPKLIIADEPTTALDVTIQAQILDLMRKLKDKISASILLITHDLGVVAEMADYVVVMYAGRVVEQGTALEIYKNPLHPYTIGLLNSKPVPGKIVDSLYSIPGQVPNPINMPDYCYFKSRCDKCVAKCGGKYPEMLTISETHKVACWRYEEEAAKCQKK